MKLKQNKENQQDLDKKRLEMQEQNQELKISYSEFKNWKECAFRHKLIYIDKLPYYSSNEYTIFGTAIHEMCEKHIPNPNETNPESIFEKAFKRELDSLKSQDSSVEVDDSLIESMNSQYQQICRQVNEKVQDYFQEFEVFSVEEMLFEEIDEFEASGRSFKGFIDMVLKTPDGKYHIIDWKTCSWGWPSAKKTDPIINYQLTFYKNYFSKKHSIPLNKIETYFVLLKRTAKKDNVEILRVSSGEKKRKNALKVLQNSVINIDNKNYIKNRLNCKYCKFYKTENCK